MVQDIVPLEPNDVVVEMNDAPLSNQQKIDNYEEPSYEGPLI
jgi:hypothetical protein